MVIYRRKYCESSSAQCESLITNYASKLNNQLNFYRYRDKQKVEVDIIIENAMGDCFAIEVKASATLTPKDFAGLERFKTIAGSRFKQGILLYDGDHSTAFGDKLLAVSIGALWS